MTVEADAVSRVFIAQQWLLQPQWISHGVWGPLHFYLVALALAVGRDPEVAPIVLNILFSGGTALVLYGFARREFDESVAWFVAAAYLLCPLAIRNSLMAVAEVPFVFFISLSMLQISRARDRPGAWQASLWAGLWLTCAGALRYEAWVLIPLFGILLWRTPRALLAFTAAALCFPVIWMAGNYRFFGDPLYSVHWATDWQLRVEGYNANLTPATLVRRALYFPQAVFAGLTPLASVLGLLGVWAIVRTKAKQSIWLVPLVAMSLVFVFQAAGGSLLMRGRYSLLLVVLFLPFVGAGWRALSGRVGHGSLIAVVTLGSMLPLSYARAALTGVGSTRLAQLIPVDVAAVPRLDSRVYRFARIVRQEADSRHGGLIVDFWAWDETYYVALAARVPARRVFISPGALNEALDSETLSQTLSQNPKGLVVLHHDAANTRVRLSADEAVLTFPALPDISLKVEKIVAVDQLTLYGYVVGSRMAADK